MPITPNDGLPEALATVRTRPLFVMRLAVRPLQVVGAAAGASGASARSSAARSRASACRARCCDWQTVRADGCTTLDVRLVLRTADLIVCRPAVGVRLKSLANSMSLNGILNAHK